MVRVLHVLSDQLSSSTKEQCAIASLRIRAAGHESLMCDLRRRRLLASALGRPLSGRLIFDPAALLAIYRDIQKHDPDVVHFWGVPARILQIARPWLGRRVTVCTADFASERGLDLVNRLRHTRFGTLSLLVHNEFELQSARDVGIATGRIRMLPYGSMSSPDSEPSLSLHCHLEQSSNVIFVGARADMLPSSHCQDLIWALDLLRVLHPHVHLLLIGEGFQQAKLEHFAQRVSVDQGVVHFMKSGEHDYDWLSQCFCFWHAGVTGDVANTVQSMSLGIPPVVTAQKNYDKIVIPGHSGFQVTCGDSAEMARKTNVLLSDSTLYNKLVQNAQVVAGRLIQTDTLAEEYLGAYFDAQARQSTIAAA